MEVKKKMLVKATGRDPSNFCVEAETLKLAVRTMLEQKKINTSSSSAIYGYPVSGFCIAKT